MTVYHTSYPKNIAPQERGTQLRFREPGRPESGLRNPGEAPGEPDRLPHRV